MHSFGYICDRNYYKQLGEITDNLEKLPRSGSILIGHCRLATFGNISEVDSQSGGRQIPSFFQNDKDVNGSPSTQPMERPCAKVNGIKFGISYAFIK